MVIKLGILLLFTSNTEATRAQAAAAAGNIKTG
jgi:hypothetical protein